MIQRQRRISRHRERSAIPSLGLGPAGYWLEGANVVYDFEPFGVITRAPQASRSELSPPRLRESDR